MLDFVLTRGCKVNITQRTVGVKAAPRIVLAMVFGMKAFMLIAGGMNHESIIGKRQPP